MWRYRQLLTYRWVSRPGRVRSTDFPFFFSQSLKCFRDGVGECEPIIGYQATLTCGEEGTSGVLRTVYPCVLRILRTVVHSPYTLYPAGTLCTYTRIDRAQPLRKGRGRCWPMEVSQSYRVLRILRILRSVNNATIIERTSPSYTRLITVHFSS